MLPLRDEEGRVVVEPISGMSENWKKSSMSGGSGCVEVRRTRSGVQVRDSKDPGGPVLHFTHAEWVAFIGGVALGEFGLSDSAKEYAV
jgi:hypothetical protein